MCIALCEYNAILVLLSAELMLGSSPEEDDSLNVIIPTAGPTTALYLDVPDPNINFTVLDMQITQAIRRPVKGTGSDVMQAVNRYYAELEDVAVAMEHSKNAGHQLLEILDLRDGPDFINLKIDEKHLRSVYNWDKNTFRRFVSHINGTRWSLVRLNVAKNATSVEIPADEKSSEESTTVEYYFD